MILRQIAGFLREMAQWRAIKGSRARINWAGRMVVSVLIKERRLSTIHVINRWLEYLDTLGIRYSHSIHPRAANALKTADAERIPAHEFAKVVVYAVGTGFGIAVVAADQMVDLGRIGLMLGRSDIRLATEPELARLFPACELGAMPPFAGSLDWPVIVDGRIAGEFMTFTIGTHRDVVRMSFADFQRLARPKVASIGLSQHVLV